MTLEMPVRWETWVVGSLLIAAGVRTATLRPA
jgi:hypothetical protein